MEEAMLDNSDVDEILKEAQINCYKSKRLHLSGKYCKLIFDGLLCWQDTPAGVLATQNCTNDYVKWLKNGIASRQCDVNGDWLTPENLNSSWTNYTACEGPYIQRNVQIPLLNHTIYDKWIPVIEYVTQFGYILSTISLIIALFIFIHIKRLHCARNKLHIHLFVSFVLRALMSLIKNGFFVEGVALPHEIVYTNGVPDFNKTNFSWHCKAIISLWNYFIISNYTFLLMEENGVVIYYCLGWGFPVLFIVPWIILKACSENVYCWTTQPSKYIALLIDIPIGLTVIINFLLFTVIMRILFVKLTSMYAQRWIKYQKLIRAILILIPLFGIPYTISFVLSFYVTQNQTFEILWLFFDQTFIAFQGLFASLVYCLMNNEVQVEIARKYRSFKDKNNDLKRRSRTISHTMQIIPLTEDIQEPQNLGVKEQLYNKTSDYF